jgi:hypothetical protein
VCIQPEGVVKIHTLGKITEEKGLVEGAIPELKGNIEKVHIASHLVVR